MVKITFDLNSEEHSRLKTLAKQEDSSIARVCRREIKAYIFKNKEKAVLYNDDGTEID